MSALAAWSDGRAGRNKGGRGPTDGPTTIAADGSIATSLFGLDRAGFLGRFFVDRWHCRAYNSRRFGWGDLPPSDRSAVNLVYGLAPGRQRRGV